MCLQGGEHGSAAYRKQQGQNPSEKKDGGKDGRFTFSDEVCCPFAVVRACSNTHALVTLPQYYSALSAVAAMELKTLATAQESAVTIKNGKRWTTRLKNMREAAKKLVSGVKDQDERERLLKLVRTNATQLGITFSG